ncbi:hypothetical protein K523DRAFT_225051, partial [Schizophyllum commune Tattone D]
PPLGSLAHDLKVTGYNMQWASLAAFDAWRRLTVKTYPGTDTVLGLYRDQHTHPVGTKNLRWTRLPKETKRKVEMMLRLGMNTTKIV